MSKWNGWQQAQAIWDAALDEYRTAYFSGESHDCGRRLAERQLLEAEELQDRSLGGRTLRTNILDFMERQVSAEAASLYTSGR